MATYLSQSFRVEAAEAQQMNPSDMIIEFGEAAFVTTGTTLEVYTRLTECIAAFALPVDPTFATNTSADHIYCDRIITTAGITFTRGASGKSALKFSYVLIGRKKAVAA